MRSRVWIFSSLIIVAASLSLSGQETQLSVSDLRAQLAKLQRELKVEQAALAKQQKQNAKELAALKSERKQAAETLLSAEIEHERNKKTLKTLRQQDKQTAEQSGKLVDDAKTLTDSIRSSAEQLRIHLREVPGTDGKMKALQVAAKLTWDAKDAPQQSKHLKVILKAIDEAHEDATTVSIKKVSIYTASKKREEVQLLSLGHARFAYATKNGDRVGLALASPEDASGYRWSENIGSNAQELVRQAIAAIEAGKSTLIVVPLDPTGRIQPDTLNQDQNLVQQLRDGGLVMLPLAALAVIALVLILQRAYVFYPGNPTSNRLAAKVLEACRARQFDEAQRMCERSRGAVGRVLAACLSRRTLGQRAMEDSIQEQLLYELPRLQRFMRGIVTLAGVAPLLGLLGTVTGIVRTFGVIRAFGNANPSLMAGGISEALLTTATGLVVAVPILILHSVLRGRSDSIIASCESHAARLLTTLAHDQVPESTPQTHQPSSNGEADESAEGQERQLAHD